jgi:hypothetical protein
METDQRTQGKEETERFPLIFIAGFGRSGSTLLDKILGCSDEVMSLGEIVLFDIYRSETPYPKVAEDFLCSCGEKFNRCSFWCEVLRTLAPDEGSIVNDTSYWARLRWVWRLIVHQWTTRRGGRPAPYQLGDDMALFGAIMALHGSRTKYLCDSSKDFARLARLYMNPGIEIIPIHLVRDGRGVAFSKTKKESRDLGIDDCGYFEALVTWIGVNLLNRLIFFVKGVKPLQISYDLFCQDPDRYIVYLNSRLNLNIPQADYVDKINQTEFHLVNGNPDRFGPIPGIRHDDKWKQALPPVRFALATLLSTPFNWLWVRSDSVSQAGNKD